MNPYPQVVHIFTIPVIVLVLVFLFIPSIALAANPPNQTVKDTIHDNGSGMPAFALGTGLSGTVTSFVVNITNPGATIVYDAVPGEGGAVWGYIALAPNNQSSFDIYCPQDLTIPSGTNDVVWFPCPGEPEHVWDSGDNQLLLQIDGPDGYGKPVWYVNGTTATVSPYNPQGSYDINAPYILWNEGGAASCLGGDFATCINTVDPEDEQVIATSSLPYMFAVDGYISTEDYEEGARIMIKIDRNTDQQAQGALLAWDSAFGNKTFLELDAAGEFDVSTSSEAISENLDFPMDRLGLYRARWELQVPGFSLFGFALNYSTIESLNTRFTIGTSTPLDKIQLDQEEYLENVIGSIEGDPLEQCNFNFFDSAFDFRLGSDLLGCIGGMLHWFFVLPPGVLENTVVQLKEGFLTRVPWGYFTRIVTAVQEGEAGALPTVHADIPLGGGNDLSIEFDIDDMIAGAATVTDSMVSPDGDTLRDIAEPIIQLIVGLLVLMFIWKDIMRSV